jgi:hypothetical protein
MMAAENNFRMKWQLGAILFLASFDLAVGRPLNGQLANNAIAFNWRVAHGDFQTISVEDKLNGGRIPLDGECFELVLSNDSVLKSSDFTLLAPPAIERLKPDTSSPVAAQHFAGKQLSMEFSAPQENLTGEYHLILRDGSTYLHQELALSATGKDVFIKKITLLDETIPGAKTAGTVEGSPVIAGNFFFGYEHPMSENLVNSNFSVSCSLLRNAVLKSGETLIQSCVIGVAPAGQLRRGFLAYVERERAHPYRPFLHYNSWYDLRDYSQQQCVNAINQIGTELTMKRGVPVSSFLFDDGWDDTKTLWSFSSRLPVGFTPLRDAVEKYHSSLGVWISPFGGYGSTKQQRLQFGSAEGFETNASGFSLAGTNYYKHFHDICVEMMQKYGINQFKFDGLAADAVAGNTSLARDGDAMLKLIGQLRAIRPDLYISQTVGTWPSPFWLFDVDSTWRGGLDHGFYGKGSLRQEWITYRDMVTYRKVVRCAPLYPLNSIMLHGIIYAKEAENLTTADDEDFADEVHEFFGTGTQLQEMYLTPGLLNKQNWNDLAEGAKWSRANADVLVDTHWIGGDPGQGEVYGWASWSPRAAILVLRNPDDQAADFMVDATKVFELPPGTKKTFWLHSPWQADRHLPKIRLKTGAPQIFHLRPFEVLVLES